LVGLYEEPEKPENPIDFIKQFLGGPSDVDVEALRHENDELKRKVEELQAKIDELTAQACTLLAPLIVRLRAQTERRGPERLSSPGGCFKLMSLVVEKGPGTYSS
ncbi:hypothetical protein BDK51DRAFT_31134, partial [Blyttiomyces helicus]